MLFNYRPIELSLHYYLIFISLIIPTLSMLRRIHLAYNPSSSSIISKYRSLKLNQRLYMSSMIDNNLNKNIQQTNHSNSSELLITNQVKNCFTIIINRPKALNSLNLDICYQMNHLLLNVINKKSINPINNNNLADIKHHQDDSLQNVPEHVIETNIDDINVFILKGNGTKAFCAGGDVKSVWMELNKSNHNTIEGNNDTKGIKGFLPNDFFRYEYLMNYLLSESLVPQISFWDGIVMGGGVGISIYGEYRIATENTVFAMPETAIGLFPDVGGSSWLPHLENGIGNYIALTGCRLYAKDLLHTGIATHFISSKLLPEVEVTLQNTNIPKDPKESRKLIKSILERFQAQSEDLIPSKSSLLPYQSLINKCFHNITNLDMIYHNLQNELLINDNNIDSSIKTNDNNNNQLLSNNNWIQNVLHELSKMSPMSLQLTLEQLKRGKKLDLKGCLRMEYRVMIHCIHSNDFKEGIRALLIDKDNTPTWIPHTYQDITEDMVKKYFETLNEHDFNIFDHQLYPHLLLSETNL